VDKKIFKFMDYRHIASFFSIALMLIAIGSLAIKGLNFGLDFTGGTLVEVEYQQAADLNSLRAELNEAGFSGAVVQHFGSETDVMIRIQRSNSAKLGDEILAALRVKNSDVVLERIEFVGPQVGEELKEQGGLAMLLALAMIMVYVAVRFQLKFSLGAVAALAHDVLITLGVFSLLGLEFDLTVLAAILAVIGYSLNDTIVVSDRIRENFRLMRAGDPAEVINESLTQTFSRTIVTSLTTLLVLIVLFVFGGELIHGFSIALLIGVLIGTYSSIYVSANVLLLMHISKDDLIVHVKDDEEYETP
jgi:preprotein translocase subunit SecF